MKSNPSTGSPARHLDKYRRVSTLARSVLFDLEFYELQADRSFRSRREAAAHFLDEGIDAGHSISPLFQDEWYRFNATRSDDPGFPIFFAGADVLSSTSPFFDARVFAQQRAAAGLSIPQNSREALEQFLEGADDSTLLPLHSWCVGQPTLGEARARAIDTARTNLQRAHHVRSRLIDNWKPGHKFPPSVTAHSRDTLVSVVMPVRNRAHIVGRAIESVLGQTHTRWELIIVDDGSTDDTAAVASEFAARDARISLITQPPGGVCAARNAGLAAAAAGYVAFLDSDNEWLPDFIAQSLPAFADTAIVATHSAAELVDDDGHHAFLAMGGDREDLLIGGNFIDLNTLIARRSAVTAIGGFDENLKRWVDYDLVIRLSSIGRLHFVPSVGVTYSYSADVERISTVEVTGWEQVVLSKYLLDWPTIATAPRRADLISIVMLTYADWRMTLEAVRSVLDRSASVEFELIVVDNGSPDSVREILAAGLYSDARLRVISLPRNTNFALGSNIGFAQSTGRHVLFLNNDVLVGHDWLAPLVKRMDDDHGLAGAQSLIRRPNGEIESSGLVINAASSLPENLTESVSRPVGARPVAISGISSLYRAAEFSRVQGFDPIYSNGYEDADLALRLAGTIGHAPRFAVVPESEVTHFSVFSPGRFAHEASNERLFRQRWATQSPD